MRLPRFQGHLNSSRLRESLAEKLERRSSIDPVLFQDSSLHCTIPAKNKHFFATLNQATLGSRNPEATALYRVKYRQHNERVQAIIPAEKLLVFNVKQGWQPYCANSLDVTHLRLHFRV
ncbi:hypothetical protein OS493_021279 [Desmophyllum pertusum]|uniref:Uncharacterized protein n=1 Tax=Desmophyllum pertusum TaxID=174260 RepID=A0A9W9ZBU3_9CNID|nr:hypothetical protein OS493_021279 [Desmophyllum pertusum]